MRRAQWLRPSRAAQYPRELVCFDTETVERYVDDTTVEHVLSFGWAAYTRFVHERKWLDPEWLRFATPLEFWRWLESTCRDKQAIYCYCHNANFDWQVLRMTTALPELGWRCDTAIIEDPPNYFRWRKGDKTLKLLDTTNYWRVSLAEIGSKLSLPKLDFPANWDDPIASDIYCIRDVEILIVALREWIAWLQEHQLGGLGISLAQQAWKAYIYRFLDAPIFIDDNEQALELARDAYYGGRTEALYIGTFCHDIQCLDINSMYPYVMREHEYPTRLHGRYTKVSLAELTKWTAKYAVVARVLVDVSEPVFPERSKHGLLFPIGQFQTCLTTPELIYALEHNYIITCLEAAIYDKAKIFTRFIDELYELRLGFAAEGNETAKWYVKILMNSLYGKFGQRSGHEEIIGSCDPNELYVETEYDADTGIRYRVRHIAGLILSRAQESEARYSHPAIAAHVTGYARMMLWKLLQIAGIENTYYMDTDSLHVNAMGAANLASYVDPQQLGYLKVEKVIDTAIYYGPKDYELDGKRVIKGVSAKALELDVGFYSQSQWVSMKGACLVDHSGGPLVRRVSKRFTREYRKGRKLSNNRVSPWSRSLADLRRWLDTD